MRGRRVLGASAVAVVALLTLGQLTGSRITTHAVAAPADDASAAEVALTYLDAVNERDFRLAKQLYPSSSGYSRVRPVGHYDDVLATRLLAEDPDGDVRAVGTEQGQTLVWVMVRYTASGFAAGDWAVPDGPGGTGYKLSRDDLDDSWRIVDSGTP